MTPMERANQLIDELVDEPTQEEAIAYRDSIAAAIEEAENAAVAAALADVVKLLRHSGKIDTAARLVHCLEEDRQKVKKGFETAFPNLRAAVPLPV